MRAANETNDMKCVRCRERIGTGAPAYCDPCVQEMAKDRCERAAWAARLERHGGGDAPAPSGVIASLMLVLLLLPGCAGGVAFGVATVLSTASAVWAAKHEADKAVSKAESALSAGAPTGALASTLCPRTVCFSPNHCDAPVVAALDAARDSLDVAVYGLNSPSITDAVLRAFARKVAVRVIVDRTQLGGHAMHVQVGRLIAAGIPVKRQHHAGIMHDKFVVVDDAMVETGSFNWTTRATDVNDENVLVLCDAALAGLFAERFIAMWAEDWEVEP